LRIVKYRTLLLCIFVTIDVLCKGYRILDINTAEVQVKKLLEYLEDIKSKRPNMYQKSKNRWRDLGKDCIQIVRIISEIIQDETLAYEDDEFSANYTRSTDMYNMITSMESEIQRMKGFISPLPLDRSGSLSSSDRITIMKNYESVLENVALSDIPYQVVQNCAKIIWRWFSFRFKDASKVHPNFRYNIRRIKDWIVGIVILFGYHHEHGDIHVFVQTLNDWGSKLDNPNSDKYSVPYEVYDMCKNWNVDKFNLSAVVMWDILKDSGYKEILRDGDIYPREDAIYNLYADKCPDLLDNYRNYVFDPSVIDECKLRGV